MKAIVSVSFTGLSSLLLACSKAVSSGPCGSMQLCSEMPPGTKPCGLPSLGEDDEIDIRRAWSVRRRGHDREDRRIGVIEQQRAHRREAPKIVFVRRVIAVPSDHVK